MYDTLAKDSPLSGQHYFSENPQSDSQPNEFTIEVLGRELVLETDSGVFSQHGLDKGTAVLLHTMKKLRLTALSPGSVLCDLGCGSGAIALTLAVLYPECTVIAVDVNERARQLCAKNAQRHGLKNVQVIAPEEFDSQNSVDLLWSNPPIRIGKEALHTLLETWLGRLSVHGVAHLVVSKNLGADSLAQWLKGLGYPTEKLASSKGFRVLQVTR